MGMISWCGCRDSFGNVMHPRLCCRGGWLYGMCLRTICGSFKGLRNLDIGIGEGGSIGESGESFLFCL